MSLDAEKIKKLVAFKKKLEKRVEELESELDEQTLMLETVNSILLEKGFKRAEITKTPAATEVSAVKKEEMVQPLLQYEDANQLKTVTGEPLANMHINHDSLHVIMAEDKHFNINTPPFTQFLIERVLAKMQEKDSELARNGQLTPDKIFSYNILQENDKIHELVIKNFDTNRLRELKSSIRWTLEKMYEKTKD
ncbi:hypothetical protein E3J49_04970 [Candidatus Bathyarchaeota archaeon]|nr:MAG: hypothetical protein E3J49_04970 [Candidatus Bathyarchaeota archaeon]